MSIFLIEARKLTLNVGSTISWFGVLFRETAQYSRELQQGTLSQISPSSSKLLSLGVYHRTLPAGDAHSLFCFLC